VEKILTKQYEVRSHEADHQGKAKVLTLLNFLQDAALEHSQVLGLSVQELFRRGLTWVLSHYHVIIQRYPDWKETVTVRTWPSEQQEFFGLRDFEMTDARGERVLAATTSFVALNLRTKQPVNLENLNINFAPIEKKAVTHTFPPLPVPEQADLELTFKVRRGDLDINRHVNHTVYMTLALETVPPEVFRKKRPAEIEVVFKSEALYGDQILSRTQLKKTGDEIECIHQLCREDRKKDFTLLRTRWK